MSKSNFEVLVKEVIIKQYTVYVEANSGNEASNIAREIVASHQADKPDLEETKYLVVQVYSEKSGDYVIDFSDQLLRIKI